MNIHLLFVVMFVNIVNDMEGWSDEGLQDSGTGIAYWENAIECLIPALHRYLREG